ncbi:hypothetical protein IGI04_026483 [Brassica rapa subsp. trilocularis]|uniref:Uncharacterized protein n=1 Tax=Brassica rapa subsp. trilocularis TaxID=1813537 RepID=A0ABQ7KYT1_BRACM|nr:hypothetical protein IGI04_026483 [Brassica rapa subsp. trilocularis]
MEFLFTVLPGPHSSPPTNFSHVRAQAVTVCLLLRRKIIRTTSSSTSFFEPQPSSIAERNTNREVFRNYLEPYGILDTLTIDEVAVHHIPERLIQSDCTKSLAFSHPETHIFDPGATSQSDLPRSLPIQSDPLERHTKVACDLSPGDTKNRPWSDFPERHLQVAPRLEGQEELCFINNNGSWYKKEPKFQYNNYQQKSYPNNQQSGYPPRNNQQGSYQPQQNPSSGSSAPQESSTDTLLKQILESQTRSEKQVGYELKNLHSKIDGSYNELNNKFSHLASTVFEYHMEFLETFGCIWSSKEVIRVVFGRALPGATSRSDYMRSLCTTSRSDSSRATARSRSRFHIRRHTYLTLERPLRATYQGRSRSRATRWSDTPKSLATSCPETPKIGPGATSRSDTCKSLRSNHNASSELATQLLILRHFSPERCSMKCPRQLS